MHEVKGTNLFYNAQSIFQACLVLKCQSIYKVAHGQVVLTVGEVHHQATLTRKGIQGTVFTRYVGVQVGDESS